MKKYRNRLTGITVAVLILCMTVFCSTVCAADDGLIRKDRVFQVNSDAELHEEPDPASAVTAELPGGTPVIVREDAADGWCRVAYREQTGYVQVSFLSLVGSWNAAAADRNVPDEQTVQDNGVQSEGSAADVTATQSKDNASHSSGAQSADNVVHNSATQSADNIISDAGMRTDDQNAVSGSADTLEDEFKRIQEQNLLAYQEAENAKAQKRAGRIWGIVIAVLVIAIFAVGITTTLAGSKGKKNQE